MNMLKRSMAMFLVVCLMFSAVPMTTFAAETDGTTPNATESTDETVNATEEPTEATEDPYGIELTDLEITETSLTYANEYRILHLDCGRKYFTKDWIIALINEMEAAGFTHLELAFGNDGLRFLLDDMSVGSYSDDQVTAAIQAGNKKYYDFGTNELTESEMNDIIAHANSKGIEIIPLLNNPGHMNAIVSAASTLTGSSSGYNGSSSTVDLENTEAVAFVKGLVEKYVAYFDGMGCNEFNFGADEYANDVYSTGSMGFGALTYAGKYQLFVNYVNEMAALIKGYGMVPVAFNDGIYFNKDTSYNFDTQIMVDFWTSGWTGYQSASASIMESLGHQMINANGDYYYVLGKSDHWDSNGYTYASNWSNTAFMGSTVSSPMGGMFCIWCDYPNAETETQIAANTRMILRAMAAEMQGKDGASISTEVVSGGFNADGTLNRENTDEPEEPGIVTKTDESTDISVTAPGLTDVTATKQETSTPWTGYTVSVTYDVQINGGDYTGEAEIRIPYDAAFDGCYAFIGNVGDDTFEVAVEDDYFVGTVPHFSNVTISGQTREVIAGEDTVTSNGGTVGGYVLDTDGTLDEGAQYLIVHKLSDTTGVALTYAYTSVNVTINPDGTATPAGDATDAIWTREGNTMYHAATSRYWCPGYTGTWVDAYNVYATHQGNGAYTVRGDYGYTYYNNGWVNAYDTSGATLYLYKYSENTARYTIDAALQENRIASLTVTNDGYTNETWAAYETTLTAAQAKLAEVEAATYSSESAANTALSELIAAVNALEAAKNALAKGVAITIKYVGGNGATIKTETVTVADNATTYTVSNFNHNGKFYTVANTTLDITPATVITYTVTVEEAEEDLSTVTPLTLEYWQTNTQVVDGVGSTTSTRSVAAVDAYSKNGIEVITLVPEDTYTKTNNKATDPQVNYWRSRLLNRSTNEQSPENGDDETLSGTGFTKIRYWNGTWAVYTVDNEWLPVETLADYQFVLYFMNDMNLADEISVGTSDWGKKGDGTMAGQYLGLDHVSIAFQVVYEDGTTSPATTSAADLDSFTYLVDKWGTRGVGTIALNQIGDYQIWKVTAETGTHTTSYDTWNPNSGTPAYVTNFVWDENELTVWEDAKNPVSHYTILNPAGEPSKEGAYANLTWDETNESILIRIYIKTVETEDSLKVVYYDEKFGDTLYEYYISVVAGDNFNDDIGKYMVSADGTPYIDVDQKPGAFTGEYDDENTRIDVTDYGITNAVPKAQHFETDLTLVPEAVGKYRNDLYTYTGSEISEDGKTLYLYYNIDTSVLSPNFVVDFGLPLQFPLSQVVGTGKEDMVSSVTVNSQTRYGTLSYDVSAKMFTYTPTTVLQNIDVLTISILFDGETVATTTNVGVTPATTVYYGEQFLKFSGNWATEGTYVNVGYQRAEVLGDSSHYGYDAAYSKNVGASDGTAKKSVTIGDTATFTFTGTGIQVFANSTPASGYVSVLVKNQETGAVVKVSMVDTVASGTEGTDTTGGQIGKNLSGLPVVSLVDLTGLPHATYEVTVSKIMDSDPVYIDGIRVFGTVDESKYDAKGTTGSNPNPFLADEEDAPDFYEVRDLVMKAIGIQASDSVDYKTMFNQIYADTVAVGNSAVITSAGAEYGTMNRQDLLDNGPKNELYLFEGDTLTLNISTDRVIQLGLKAPEGSASFTLNGTAKTLSSTVDMFYKIAEKGGSTHTITITNTGDKILSVTLLKICDDPNVTFPALTEENIKAILANAGYTEESEAPTYTMVELKGTDVLIDGTVFDYTGEAIEPTITVNVGGTQLVEGKDYSVTYTNNVDPGTATVTIRGIATASETLGYTGEIKINYTINAPAIVYADATLTVKLVDYTGKVLATNKIVINGKEQDAAVFTAEEIIAAANDKLPEKYAFVDKTAVSGVEVKCGNSDEVTVQIGKTATLKITYVNLFGREVGSAIITVVQTSNGYCRISASEIRNLAPAGRRAVWLLPAVVLYGNTVSIAVPVI